MCILMIILIICFKFWHKYSNKILESAMTKDERLMLFLQQCKKLDVDDFIEHILPRMQANCAYPVISGLYLFVNNNGGQAENNGRYRLYNIKIEHQ